LGNLNGPDASTVRHIQLVPRIVDQHFMTIGGDPTCGGVSHLRKIVADMPDPGKENLPPLNVASPKSVCSPLNVAQPKSVCSPLNVAQPKSVSLLNAALLKEVCSALTSLC
jgi:hypothetical protein